VASIVSKFEEPGADKPLEQQSPSEKERSEARTEEVVELVAKMNECGAPPKDIMGEMPPGKSQLLFFSDSVVVKGDERLMKVCVNE